VPGGVDGAADIERALRAIVASGLELYLAEGHRGRAFADEIVNATGSDLAVQDCRGTLQHFNAFYEVRVDPREAVALRHLPELQAVKVLIQEKSSRPNESITREALWAVVVGKDTGSVSQRFLHGLSALRRHLISRHDRDRLRRLDDRRVGLGAGCAVCRDIALDRSPGALPELGLGGKRRGGRWGCGLWRADVCRSACLRRRSLSGGAGPGRHFDLHGGKRRARL
jgi:hypothetical protein